MFKLSVCFVLALGAASAAAATTATAPTAELAPAGHPATDSAFRLPDTFAQSTTVADLRKRFGAANVKIVEEKQEDGSKSRSVVLFADDPSRRAYVEFHDSTKLEGVARISVRDAGSRWRGKGDVHIGMSFAELRKANGKPFYYSAFEEKQRFFVHDGWSPSSGDEEAKLGNLDVADGEHMYFGVELGLRATAKALPANAYPTDDSVSSDDPQFPLMGEFVEVTVLNATTSLDDEWE
ncbi:MAG: hypothetical protein ABIQ97_01065 [Lysobacteraceae bacterium]